MNVFTTFGEAIGTVADEIVDEQKVVRAVAVLHCSIAALEGPEFLSRERRAEIGIQLRAMVEFIEHLGGPLA